MTGTDDDREVPESAEPEDEEYEEYDENEAAPSPGSLPFEAEPADVLEQAQAVPADEDDYR
ncbi:MAG TPA: hypothetical protein VH373_12095 [Jatrophihabitantaceae bacterium]|jgi:hypothetical protein